MQTWPLQHAKARLSELVKLCLAEGPQQITLRGQDAVTLVPTVEWNRLIEDRKPTLKDWLLTDFARTDDLIPPRQHKSRRRQVISFED